MVTSSLDRLPNPLHREFDICRLQMAPAFDLGLVSILRVAFEIFLGQFPGGRMLLGELFPNEGVSGHGFRVTAPRGFSRKAKDLPDDLAYNARSE